MYIHVFTNTIFSVNSVSSIYIWPTDIKLSMSPCDIFNRHFLSHKYNEFFQYILIILHTKVYNTCIIIYICEDSNLCGFFFKFIKKRKKKKETMNYLNLNLNKVRFWKTLKSSIEEIKSNVTKMALSYHLIFSKHVYASYWQKYGELNFGIH